jgi:chitinase
LLSAGFQKNIHVHTQEMSIGFVPVTSLPQVSISSPVITEGNSGTKRATFTVSLSQSPFKHPTKTSEGLPLTARWTTVPGTATAGSDFTAKSGTLTFAAGTTVLSQEIGVPVVGDTSVEGNETFAIKITAKDAAYAGGSRLGTCTIKNDDGASLIAQ